MTDTFKLNNGYEIPCVGFGTWQTPDGDTAIKAVSEAIRAGYCHIDTAACYGNETSVGKGIKVSGVERSRLFVTGKVWNSDRGYGKTMVAFEKTMADLELDYLDLYLVHWPVPGCFCNTWRIFEKLQASGVIKSIGVSNFSIHDLELLKESSDIVPAVNQVETHPLFQNPELITYCQKSGITLQAYTPLARGAYLNSPLMIEIGNRHKKTPAQIGLRWLIQQNIAVIPKSEQKNHLEENSKIFDFSLTPEEMAAISAMNTGQRIINAPEDIVSYL